MNRIAMPAVLLAFGMMAFAMVSIGLFQWMGWAAVGVWVVVLVVCGVCLRRTLWGEGRVALSVCGAAVLVFFLPVLAMSNGDDSKALESLRVACLTMVSHYLPFYWLPFGVGLLVGGIRRRRVVEEVG